MLSKTVLLLTCMLSVMILAYKDINRYLPLTIEGVVLDATTKKPISRLHVFTKKGEEETFTNNEGVFSFTSWQSLPLVVTVQDPGGLEKHIKVNATPVKLKVYLP